MFELTYRCNFHCRHCYLPHSYRKKREIKTKEALLILDELKNIGCFYLGFTGGEVFLRKDILNIFWYAKKKGFEVIIYTNGSLIDKTVAKELKRIRVNKVDITIPAMSKPAFERISGVLGSREKVFAAINLLRENKVSLGFKTCVLQENESEIKDIQDFARSSGALHRLDNLLSPRLNGSVEPYRHRGRIIEERREKRDKETSRDCFTPPSAGFAMTGEESFRNDVNLFKCGVGISQAAITPQGELKPCLMIDSPKFRILGENKVKKADFRAAWGQLKEFISSIKPDENYNCGKCELQSYCKWCPARGWLYNKTFTSCEPESRKNARNTIQNL
ncbi:MAG: radical SAM protein [Candidatus Omnitrophica bacterium]|nr:radical SAM protein [Candidatus Omnitrophota bacterium]